MFLINKAIKLVGKPFYPEKHFKLKYSKVGIKCIQYMNTFTQYM